jgi:tyrosinase
MDAASPSTAAIWDATTGIGGNGDRNATPFHVLTDGPFRNLTPAYQGSQYKPHTLSRNFNNGSSQVGNMFGEHYTPAAVATTRASETYAAFRYSLEGGPHGAIHASVGGDMAPATSPNDPVFFLHHTQIDRLWAQWQDDNAPVRTNEYAGPRTAKAKTTDPEPEPAGLADVMKMLGMDEDLAVQEVMDIQGGLLCYSY